VKRRELVYQFIENDVPMAMTMPEARERVAQLAAEVTRLRAALAWYSNHENYTLFHSEFTDDANIHHDNGQRARVALEVTQ